MIRKGFKDELGLIDFDGRLIIPMRDVNKYKRIQSVQFIDAYGEKKFLPGAAAKNAVFFIGTGKENWLCEGYATGLSVRDGLKLLCRSARVVVCFSAANIRAVAARLGEPRCIGPITTKTAWASAMRPRQDVDTSCRQTLEPMRTTITGARACSLCRGC